MQPVGVKFEIHRLSDIISNFHLEVELLFLMSGEAEVTIADESFIMKKNSVIVVNSEKRHSVRTIENGMICIVKIDYQTISDYLGSSLFLFFCNSVAEKNGDYDKLISLLQKIIATMLMHGGKEDFGTYSLYYQLLDILSKKYLIDQHDARYLEHNNDSNKRIHEIICYMQSEYNREITLNELAENLYLSNAYLSRFFKKNFGKNFKDYLNEIRVVHAIDDLLGSEKTMTKIAMDNGFPSVSRFNQVFKELYHVSPLAYRESYLGQSKGDEPQKKASSDLVEEIKEYVYSEHIVTGEADENMISLEADVSNYRSMHKNWNRAINVGPLTDLMQGQVQSDLLHIHRELSVTYIRFWNLFDNYICDKDAQFNFTRLDRSIEFLLENKMKPFIVLGGKARDILAKFGTYIYYQDASENQFYKNTEAWKHLMKSFCVHILETFGVEEVSTWVFEIRKPQEWEGIYDDETEAKYEDWFEITVTQLRKYFPYVLIGGCEGAVGWTDHDEDGYAKLFEFWERIHFRPDFISAKVYPYENNLHSMNPEYMRDVLLKMNHIMEKYGYGAVPIMVTEWSNTVSNRDIYNDTCYKGAYLIRNLTMNMDMADKIIYWNASDVFGEYADSADILYGGVGILNKHGMPKPVFWAFQFLNGLYKYQICCARNYIVTTDGKGNYRILCNNLRNLGYEYHMGEVVLNDNESDYERYFENLDNLFLNIQLKNIRDGIYDIRRREVSKESGSLLDELIRWNKNSALKTKDVEYLRQTCQPKLTLKRDQAKGGRLNINVELGANAFELIEITYCMSNEMQKDE